MNKKHLIAAAVLILLLGGVIVFRLKQRARLMSPIAGPAGEMEEVKLATWEDPAGFEFSYPENINIDPHEKDEENYAHLELMVPSDSVGKIIIWLQETDYTDIEDWVGEVEEGGAVLDTELDGEPAKKIVYSDPQKLVTAAIDVDALVLLEMFPDEKGYWQEVYSQILNSFTFIPLEGELSESEGAGVSDDQGEAAPANVILEAEEVIE